MKISPVYLYSKNNLICKKERNLPVITNKKQEVAFVGLPSWLQIKQKPFSSKKQLKPVVYKSKNAQPTNIEELRKSIGSWTPDYDLLVPKMNYVFENSMQNIGNIAKNSLRSKHDSKSYHVKIESENFPTKNRNQYFLYTPPEFKPDDKKYICDVPIQEELNIVKTSPFEITPLNEKTIMELDFSQAVKWNSDKVARDIMQNFFDGHSQTLDGVKIIIDKLDDKKSPSYNVRIEGLSTYDPDKAILYGETTKRDNPNAAGNFGEGSKMTMLKLLADFGVETCDIGSNNWNVEWRKDRSNINGKEVLAYKLTQKEQYDGSYIEFKTSNVELLNSLVNSVNRFYHSGNKDFHCPDFENDIVGIKLLPKGEKGGFYISGMQFEYSDEYDNLENASIFIKQKPPVDIFNPTRDRHSANKENFYNFGKFCAGESSKDECVDLINALRPYWRRCEYSKEICLDSFLDGILIPSKRKHSLKIDFPKNYCAIDSEINANKNHVGVLAKCGHIICKERFKDIGMNTAKQEILANSVYKVLEPNEKQIKRIAILREALKTLAIALMDEFEASELETKIYLTKFEDETAAEAIVHGGKSYGIWMSEYVLDEQDFGNALGVVLHELCHKSGSDGSENFSYKLTHVMQKILSCISQNPAIAQKFSDLSNLWDEL